MPQFDPSIWPTQLFWLALSFVILLVLMTKVALPRISEVLEEREFRINDSLRKAEGLRQDAEDAIAAYERMMADARAKAQEQVRQSRERAAAQAAERHAELTERLAEDIATAERRIAAAKTEAIAGVRNMAVEVAGLAVKQLVGEPIADAVVSNTVDAVLKETER
jgi:F-type H+-transporting ATPase subunit b